MKVFLGEKKDKFIHPSKKLGQNFLVDNNVAKKIVELSNVQKHDLIIEVGPGTGALTQFIIDENKPTIAIELDKRLYSDLKNKYEGYRNFTIINNDILEVDFNKLVGEYKNPILISNLPYSISSPMILKFIQQNKIKKFICMLQKEMVDRVVSSIKKKEYNGLSVIVQYYSSVKTILNVKPSAFLPPPKVNSAVVEIIKNKKKFDNSFNKFVRLCFTQKRKTLINNLKNFYEINKINNWINQNKKTNCVRAEELDCNELHQLYESLR